MKKGVHTTLWAVAALLVPICATSAFGMFDQLRPWVGNQRPAGGGGGGGGGRNDDYDRARAEENARQEARQAQYDEYYREEDAALKSGNYQEALRLALQRQGMWDGPKVRSAIALYHALIANQNGDYQAAIAYYKEASSNPGYAEFANENRKKIEQWLAGEEKKKATRAAVADLNGAANRDRSPAPVARLDFMESTGAFGTKVVKPVQAPAAASAGATAGTDTKAADQLKSGEYHGQKAQDLLPANPEGPLEPSSAEARKLFDTAGQDKGHLDASGINAPPGSVEMPVVPGEMANDPIIAQDVKHLTEWNQQLRQANEELKKAQTAVNQAQDPGAKAMAVITLNAAKTKSEGLRTAVESAKKEIEARKVYLAPFKVGGAPAAPEQQTIPQQPVPSTPAGSPSDRQPGS